MCGWCSSGEIGGMLCNGCEGRKGVWCCSGDIMYAMKIFINSLIHCNLY